MISTSFAHEVISDSRTMRVNVGRSGSTAELVRDCGFDWYHPVFDHTLFPDPTRSSLTELAIRGLPYVETGLQALRQLEKLCLLSSLRELLIVVRCCPVHPQQYDIIALGSCVECESRKGWWYAPYFFVRGHERNLGLLWLGARLKRNVSFLVARP